jgi:predicted O-linked N-acetylglucosamine transferase (SPINDLY family)
MNGKRSRSSPKRPAGRASDGAALAELARVQMQEGKFADAEATARRLVALSPKSAEAIVLLGETQRQKSRPNDAVATFRDALAIEPANALAHYLLGLALRDAKRSAEAEFAFKDAVAANPGLADAYLELGNLYLDQRQDGEAESAYRRAIAARPNSATGHYNLGNALRTSGRLEQAAAAYREAVRYKPDYVEAWYNLGLTEKEQGRAEEAVAAYNKAIDLRPGFAEGFNNLGTALRSLWRLEEAEQAFQKALSIKNFAMPHYNLGWVFDQQGKRAEAAASYRRAIALDPKFLGAQVDLAELQGRRGETAEAEQIYRQLLASHPHDRSIQLACLQGLARLLRDRGNLLEGAECFERMLRLDPESADALASLCQLKSYMCDWRGRDEDLDRLVAMTERQLAAGVRTGMAAFDALARPLSPTLHLAIGRNWAKETNQQPAQWREQVKALVDRERRHDRLRIGYVSQDFRNQAMGHLTRTMYGLHDRSQFEIYGYAVCKDDGSVYRKTIAETCDHFRDINDLTLVDGATRIAADEIDIMIDLMGYTAGHRMGIAALRPAPVVVGFLQFPGTSGADFVDYMLTDRIVTTPEDQQFYSEQLVFLPNCYQPNDGSQEIDGTPVTRADWGLPEDAFVFCCFNNHYKIEPWIFGLWMRILQQVPDSVLWMMRINPQMEANLKREAEARGIPANRVIFAERAAKPRHLARQRLADLFLDTRYYTAHTTASDALWGGLPVLTCPGETFASRVSASLLRAAGLPELIVADFGEYERRAIHLATHPRELEAIREKWAAQRASCALFDTRRFVRNLERAYRMIWKDHLAGIPPRQLFIDEDRVAASAEPATA